MKPVTIAVLSGALSIAALVACTRHSEAPSSEAGASPAAAAELTPALPFIENDYDTALNRAREAKLPLFVEVWAPW